MNITNEDLASLAAARGADRPDLQWICTPFDSWEKNPFYSGPDQRHPEDDYDDEGRHYAQTDEEWEAMKKADEEEAAAPYEQQNEEDYGEDDIPF